MTVENKAFPNFAAGELSPKVRGRFDLPLYANGCERQKNFISETQGPAKFRTGTRYVLHTRLNQTAVLLPFQFNDEQSYILEFTNKKMRIYRNEGFIIDSTKSITGATQANPVVITSTSHGYSNGDEVFIDSVGGMTELNGFTYLVANQTANTFELTDVDGNNIDGTGFTAYTSGGTAAKIIEVDTPYTEADLLQLKFAQIADTMYIVHKNYEPRKLTRSSHTAWTLSLFTRTSDPFLDKKTITGITQANPGVVTATSHGYSDGDLVIIESVVGMTEVNGGLYTVANSTANTFELQDRDGSNVDTSGFTAYSSGGYASDQDLLPGAFAFYEGRAIYGYSDTSPERMWMSRAPQTDGTARYDDFTTGTDADHAIIFTLAPPHGKVDKIEWFAGTDKFLAIGTFGGISKATGSQDDEAITPTSINIRPVDAFGVDNQLPIKEGNLIIYMERGKLTTRSFEFDAFADSFLSIDRNLVADHITEGGINQIAFQRARPDILWGVRNDGLLIGLTFKSREDVSGWHRHMLGGTDVKVLSVGVMPRPSSVDQVWVVVERTINSLTRRYVEFFEDEPVIPERTDYFTDESSESDDDSTWRRAMFEIQKTYVHVDSALSYDGTTPGSDASATMTPAAISGTSVTFTASAAVFASTDVGRQIWKKAINGVGKGRATIITFNSSTEVVCNITDAFDNTNAMAAGNWYLTTNSISGLDHLEGQSLSIIADGAEHPKETVSSGAVTLDYQASTVHLGLGYTGFLKKTAVEAGGINGPGQTKDMNINMMGLKFLNTLGAKYGTDLYRLQSITFRSTADPTDRPPPLFTGVKRLEYEDITEELKHVLVLQDSPLPCIVQMLVPFVDTDNF